MRRYSLAFLLAALAVPALAQQFPADDFDRAPAERLADDDEDENKAEPNGFWQPEIDELPEDDERERKKLLKAWEEVYSAEAEGLERLYSDAEVKADLSAYEAMLKRMGMPAEVELDAQLGWSAEEGASMRVNEAEDEGRGGMRQLVAGVQRLANAYTEVVPFLIGLPSFEEHFKDAVIVEAEDFEVQDEDFKRADIYRAWREVDGEFVSELYFVQSRELVRILTVDTDVRFEQEKVGKTEMFSKITLRKVTATEDDEGDEEGEDGEDSDDNADSDDQRRGGRRGNRGGNRPRPGQWGREDTGEQIIVFEIKERAVVSKYTIASELSTSFKVMNFDINVDMTLSNTLVDDEVSDEQLEETKPEDGVMNGWGRRTPGRDGDDEGEEEGDAADEDEAKKDE